MRIDLRSQDVEPAEKISFSDKEASQTIRSSLCVWG